ncbi:MAG: M28 family peptidase [Flavobacteriaceae bacterium]|nr:MAG: M28 family peptidase [Flavobacteriaceae bacterium]
MKIKFFLTLSLCSVFILNAQTEAELANSTVFKKDIEGHIYFLASDELKGRQTGTPELDIAAAYIANNLRKHDVKPAGKDGSFYQNVPMEEVSAPDGITLTVNELSFDNYLAMSVKNFTFDGEAVYLGYGSEEDFKNNDVEGKLVIVMAGSEENTGMRAKYREGKKKRSLAKENGAAGLVELTHADEKMWNRYAHYFNESKTGLKKEEKEGKFVHVWMMDKELEGAGKLSESKSLHSSLSINGIETKEISSRNVVGYLEGTDPELKDEYIIYSAHYDHVGIGKPNAENDSIYNGARDNAVGTVTVLSVAENLAKYPTKRSSLFILFTGEEKGLLGSKYYVENPVIPLEKMVYCFNSDNAGYNDTSKITIFGLNRTTVSHHIETAATEFGLTAIDDPAPEQNLFDRSDNVNFAAKGIPSPTYSMGFNAFDDEINKYYHQVTDNPDNVDYDYLVKFFKSYVLSSRLIANDPKTPFWTEGDKYYEAGVKLYEEKIEEASVLD